MPARTLFSRISSSAQAIRRRQEQEARERAAAIKAPRIRLGVCSMDKKAQSKPMLAILKRMNTADEFEIVFFGDEVILNEPIEKWPKCDALLVWESLGFPLAKAQAYVRATKPFLVNDVFKQDLLQDRRAVYETLVAHSVPVPPHIIVTRTPAQCAARESPEGFEETEDYVLMNGVKICKPFVEKPSLGDNHNVWIYYPNSMGGGVKQMFRKVGNKSAEYLPDDPGRVRRDDSYIYEEFVATGGTDVKVYTVGPRYAHAEARKSPVVDGKVMRTSDGKEVRYPVLLSNTEKEIACKVVNAFQQKVCGFDLLRRDANTSYVCDVNGWSFVKSSTKYYDDAAGILRQLILEALAPHRFQAQPSLPRCLHDDDLPVTVPEEDLVAIDEDETHLPDLTDLEAEIAHTNETSRREELRCVLAVVRHGDRTPKQTLKLKVTHKAFLALFDKFKDGKGKQAKLKSPDELAAFLAAVKEVEAVLAAAASENGAADGDAHSERSASGDGASTSAAAAAAAAADVTVTSQSLKIVRTVLEHGNHFSGVNRKVQLKPTQGRGAEVTELQLIMKWGGVLTHLGRRQAQELGYIYRMAMYPRSADGGGLLRLHSTYRHDLKIYSSDEGRVQTSAAAFTKGLLDLEGSSLTPILVSLVNKDAAMLDAFGKGASEDITTSKQRLYHVLTADPETGQAHCIEPHSDRASPPPSPTRSATTKGGSVHSDADGSPMPDIPHLPDAPLQLLHKLADAIKHLTGEIRQALYAQGAYSADAGSKQYSALKVEKSRDLSAEQPYGSETLLMMFDRWRKLERALYVAKEKAFDISKIPDVYDSIKYDCIHNKHLGFDLSRVMPLARTLADCVIPAEYGISPQYKLRIGSKIAKELVDKLLLDLENVKAESFSADRDLLSRSLDLAAGGGDDSVRGGEGAAEVLAGGDNDMQTEDDEAQRVHRLAPQYVHDINSPLRHVRTRIYFTSESHIHSLLNILRHEKLNGESLLSDEAQARLDATTEFDYLTQIVFRMYEDKRAKPDSPKRFRIEVLFSNGANYPPDDETHAVCTKPRVPVHRRGGLDLFDFQAHMRRYGNRPPTPVLSTTVSPELLTEKL